VPKFEESNRVDPKLGTLMNLALCHEKEGLGASAWAGYARAASLAARAGQSGREGRARARCGTRADAVARGHRRRPEVRRVHRAR
jgi:hypothetical protein